MLRREGDGVRWWIEHTALTGADPDALALPRLALRFVSQGPPDAAVRRARELADAVEALDVFPAVGAVRETVNGYFGGNDHDAGRWEPARFDRIAVRVAEPDGRGMDLSWKATTEDPDRPASWFWSFGLGLALHSENRYAAAPCWEWSVYESPGLFRGEALNAASRAWGTLLELIGTWPEVSWGAVLYDCNAYSEKTPFEKYYFAPVEVHATEHLVRGYYWANLLTEGHVAQFAGGLPAIRTACANAGVECEPVPGREAVVVKSARPVGEFDDEQLATMREVLTPVLPEAVYRYYAGPPLRVIKEPGTAFKRIPPEIEIPWFDDDPPLKPGSGTARQLVPDC